MLICNWDAVNAEPQVLPTPCEREEQRHDHLDGVYSGGSYDSDDDDSGQSPMSYQEWATQRRPFKLPPGLPRAPGSPGPAIPCASQRACSGVGSAYDELDDEYDAWYERNVASGAFANWVNDESPCQPPPPPVAACPAISCNDDDLDDECDEWFQRNVAAGNFSSWLMDERGVASEAPADPVPTMAPEPAVEASTPSAGTAVDVLASPAKALAGVAPKGRSCAVPDFDLGSFPAAAAAPVVALNRLQCNRSSFAGGRGAADDDDDDSTPSSPTGSDCRAASEDCSRDSSRSCSVLSLHSWDTQGSSSEEVEELDSGNWEADRGASCGSPSEYIGGCVDATEPGAVIPAPLRLVECELWERTVDCEMAATSGFGAVGNAELLDEGVCAAWLETHPHFACLVRWVVSLALFDSDCRWSDEEMIMVL